MTVNGAAITINAQALTDPYLALDYYISEKPGTLQVSLLPGSHLLQADGGGSVAFRVNPDGTVSYDPALQGILSGQGTSQLTVNGAAVTINAQALSDSSLVADYYTVEQTSATFQLVLLPGTHTIRSSDGTRSITLTVDENGNISYDQSESQELGGLGTKALIVTSLG